MNVTRAPEAPDTVESTAGLHPLQLATGENSAYFPAQLFFWSLQCGHSLHFEQPLLLSCAAPQVPGAPAQAEHDAEPGSPWAYGQRRAHPASNTNDTIMIAKRVVIRMRASTKKQECKNRSHRVSDGRAPQPTALEGARFP